MRLPHARGPVSRFVVGTLAGEPAVLVPEVRSDGPVVEDDDLQLALWLLYELHYAGFEDVDDDREWDPALIALRTRLEALLEAELRELAADVVTSPHGDGDVAEQIFALAEEDTGPSLAAFVHRHATREQVVEFLRVRSVYHLKESDPQAFVLPRLSGTAKAALSELLYDEFGGGRAERLHATMYGDAMAACGLDRRFGHYVEEVSALGLAVNNTMSLFALHRRLRGAAMGHLAMFEATSSVPCRKIAAGIERVGLPEVAARYFHEHVEADAVHEQVAVRDICGSMVADDPALRDDVVLGATVCLRLEARAGHELLAGWQRDVAV